MVDPVYLAHRSLSCMVPGSPRMPACDGQLSLGCPVGVRLTVCQCKINRELGYGVRTQRRYGLEQKSGEDWMRRHNLHCRAVRMFMFQ